jgi:multidrug efflux pump subunit AcrA (membrane-fusion protein)
MAKRIPKRTPEEQAAYDERTRQIRERLAERLAKEAEWDRAEEKRQRTDTEKRSA